MQPGWSILRSYLIPGLLDPAGPGEIHRERFGAGVHVVAARRSDVLSRTAPQHGREKGLRSCTLAVFKPRAGSLVGWPSLPGSARLTAEPR